VADHGAPIAYLALEEGTPVFSSDGGRIGTVEHVLAETNVDIFEGVVIDARDGPGGFRFADATQIGALYERGMILSLDRDAAAALPEPEADAPDGAGDKLRRAWDYLSGKD
jgi:hypothetical protein